MSFNGNKIITTSGGGALLCDDESLVNKATFLATQARDQAPYYQHSNIGYNYRMSNIVAGIGRAQLQVINDRVEKRRENFDFYKELFKNVEGVELQPENNDNYSNRWLATVTFSLNKFQSNINEELRICNLYF